MPLICFGPLYAAAAVAKKTVPESATPFHLNHHHRV
jgi:hypothetical protein